MKTLKAFAALIAFVVFGTANAGPPQVADVLLFSDPGGHPVGSSSLVRTGKTIAMTINTTGLTPGDAYTVWWVIFNNPENCDGPCDGPDLFVSSVNGTVMWAAGHLIDGSGIGNFGGSLQEGKITTLHPAFSGVLEDAKAAEIHLVVRSHGPAIPELVYEMISTFDGGCDVNTCFDDQFAVHLP